MATVDANCRCVETIRTFVVLCPRATATAALVDLSTRAFRDLRVRGRALPRVGSEDGAVVVTIYSKRSGPKLSLLVAEVEEAVRRARSKLARRTERARRRR